MKISICTGAWKRPKLLEIFCKHYAELKKTIPFELIVSCSDYDSMEIVNRHGHTPVKIDNTPLYAKMNEAVVKANGSDYCILIGSDDFITEPALIYYTTLFKKGYDYIYTYDWHFYDTKTKQGLYWAGYDKKFNKGLPCGAGRALSKNLLDKINYRPWIVGYDRVLDTGMELNLKRHSFSQYGFKLNDVGIFCIDVKTDTNMTKFEKWENSFFIDGKELIKNNLPQVSKQILTF